MPVLATISGILWSIFANAAYDTLKYAFGSKDAPLFRSLAEAIDKASADFYHQYGEEFGKPNESFLARQENWERIIASIFLSTDELNPQSLNPEGFEGSKPATLEAIAFFLTTLREKIRGNFELDKIVSEKKHLKDTKKILDHLDAQQSTLSDFTAKTEKTLDGIKDTSLAQSEKMDIVVERTAQIMEVVARPVPWTQDKNYAAFL